MSIHSAGVHLSAVAAAMVIICSRGTSSFSLPCIISSNRPTSFNRSLRHPFRIYSNSKSNDDLIKTLLNNDAADDNDPYSRYTHQIAIPLSDASELHSALHAIQTSLVRDCPRLIRACVMPALLRMPLLYVDGSSLEKGNVGGSDGGVDSIIEEVVHKAIREVVYGEENNKSGTSSSSVIDIVEPILLPFQGLELQGEDNSVLYAVGNNVNDESTKKMKKNEFIDDEDDGVYVVDDWSDTVAADTKIGPSGWEILEKLVHNIQNELESKYGLETCWPLDKPQGEEIEYDDPLVAAIKQKKQKWRPRVPFVRLPNDFYQDLQDDVEKRNSSNQDDEEEPLSPIDMGFDGISPLFWYEAWGEEDILSPPGVRMQSVAVYRRMVPGGGEAESSFYVPTSSGGPQSWKSGANTAAADEKSAISMELPKGDSKLMARERREAAKAMDRLGEVEQRAEREWEEGKARWMEEMSDESLYGSDDLDDDSLAQFDVGMEVGEVTVEGDAAYTNPWIDESASEQATADSADEGSRAAIETMPTADNGQSQSESPSIVKPPESQPRRELPSIEDNPIFQRLWKGQSQVTSKGQNTALALDGTPPTKDEPLPPYPSDAHFVGAWRVVSSPLGTSIDNIMGDTESQSSDNFILRVDGQVMGGPILDAQYQHKAAGGGWRMFQAVRRDESDDDSPPITQTRLRIRLLVPPEKERVLVMEGEVNRLLMPGAGDASSSPSEGWKMASGGILEGMMENIGDLQSDSGSKAGEGLLYCAGEAWMEDADGGANRRKVGPFSLMKLKAIKRENLIYTVDVSRPISDEDKDDDVDE